MTDKPSSTSQPSMEDILASIRRIIDDDDKVVTPAATETVVEKPQEPAAFDIDDDAAAIARAEYDAAMGRGSDDMQSADPADEAIFPQRDGALWRRVAGHPLSEGETDPLPVDDMLELTEVLDGGTLNAESDDTELELSELLDSPVNASSDETDDVLDSVLSDVGAEESYAGAASDDDDSSLGIGAVTAAGLGATGAIGATASSFFNASAGSDHTEVQEDDDDEVLDLTRSIDGPGSIEELASTLGDTSRPEDDDLPPMIFEQVNVEPLETAETANQEGVLDRNFESAAVTGMTEDYAASLSPSGIEGDDRERALDERFYESDEFSGMPPEISGTYSSSLGGDAAGSRHEGAPTEDEMETVGGLVRDALRSRLPARTDQPSDPNPLVTGGAEESAARSLATLAQYDAHAPRRIYGGIKITDDEDSPTIEGVVQDTLRPMLREWLNDNLPTLVENMVKQEVDRISARSRQFVRDDND